MSRDLINFAPSLKNHIPLSFFEIFFYRSFLFINLNISWKFQEWRTLTSGDTAILSLQKILEQRDDARTRWRRLGSPRNSAPG